MALMIKGGVIFCAIVGKIVGTRIPKELELTLSFTAAEPVLMHVYGFGFALYDGVVSNPKCSGVIKPDRRFGMMPTHLDKVLMKMDHGFGADEEAIKFGFDSRGHNKLDYLGNSENRAISGRYMGVF